MNIFKILILLFLPFLTYCQSAVMYENKNILKHKAVIFDTSYILPIDNVNKMSRFEVSEEEIFYVEKILNNITIKLYGRKKLRDFVRQYVGYKNDQGGKFILINLLYYKCYKDFNKNFDGYEKDFIVGFGDYYEKNSLCLKVNLETGLVEYF